MYEWVERLAANPHICGHHQLRQRSKVLATMVISDISLDGSKRSSQILHRGGQCSLDFSRTVTAEPLVYIFQAVDQVEDLLA